jgi:hypothetical protein
MSSLPSCHPHRTKCSSDRRCRHTSLAVKGFLLWCACRPPFFSLFSFITFRYPHSSALTVDDDIAGFEDSSSAFPEPTVPWGLREDLVGALGLRLFVADAHGAARFASAIVHRDHVERIAVTFQVRSLTYCSVPPQFVYCSEGWSERGDRQRCDVYVLHGHNKL